MTRESQLLGSFQTTAWSLIREAQTQNTAHRQLAIGAFLIRYLPALRAHLVLGRRLPRDQADDVLQGFVADKILARDLLRVATPERGKLRSLLLKSLDNYFRDVHRKQRRSVQATGEPTSDQPGFDPPAADAVDPFDLAWARQILNATLEQMKSECENIGKQHIWQVFEARLLRPTVLGVPPLDYQQMVERFGFKSPDQAANVLVTAKRTFCRCFAAVTEDFADEEETPEEIFKQLAMVLHRAGGLEWIAVGRELGVVESEASHESLVDTEPRLVAEMLNQVPNAEDLWQEVDYEAIVNQLLTIPVNTWAGVENTLASSIGDVLECSAPPITMLETIKRRARLLAHAKEHTIPPDILMSIYFCSIAAALVRCDRRITRSQDGLLRFGFELCAERVWLPATLRSLLTQAATAVTPG